MDRLFHALRSRGVLGMNARNAEYIARFNPRRHYPLVDDKIRTKQLALAAGIAVPELYAVIHAAHEVRHPERWIGELESFVIKPSHGSGGSGIVVIDRRVGDRFVKSSGEIIDGRDLEYHVSNVLSGIYSLGGRPDRALVEYRVRSDREFDDLAYRGVPDIRTVVFLGVPVMAMLRLPTRLSDGKANLHQGAVGVAIDIAAGRTGAGVCGNRLVREHPDTGAPVSGFRIPGWETVLELAARCFELTQLGYLGVDVVLDEDLGPLVLELNARPGISIQIANEDGLRPRLEAVERRNAEHSHWPAPDRVKFARENFGRLEWPP